MLKVSSLFSQILSEIPRTDFEKLGAKNGTERHAKGFRSWTQFVAMLFCRPSTTRTNTAHRNFSGTFSGPFPAVSGQQASWASSFVHITEGAAA